MKDDMDDIKTQMRLQRLSALLSDLDPTDAEVRASASAISARLATQRRAVPAALKIAASIVLLFGLTWAVPPARAWMLERARAVAEKIGLSGNGDPTASSPHDAGTDITETAPVRITFAVPAGSFDIAAPAVGQLVINRTNAANGTAQATGAPDATFLVSRGLRIAGASSAQAVYTVTLPVHVTSVRLNGRVHILPATSELKVDLANH